MPLRRILLVLIVIALVLLAVVWTKKRRREEAVDEGAPQGGFVLVSTAFGHGDMIPAEYTADGWDASPPLAWDGVPDGTVTFALIMEDPDAPLGNFTHWLICEIPGRVRALPSDMPKTDLVAGAAPGVQGNNGFRKVGYGGPDPPEGKTHRYYFRLYALDIELDMAGAFTKNQLRAAMQGHILGEAILMGRYGREGT